MLPSCRNRPRRDGVCRSDPGSGPDRNGGSRRRRCQIDELIIDLTRKVELRAFARTDPYRVALDIPQMAFKFPPGAATPAADS